MSNIFIKQDGQVLLTLPNSRYRTRRSLGFIENRVLNIKRTRKKHFFRMYKGFGFSAELINEHKSEFDAIRFNVDGETMFTTPQCIQAKGIFRQYNELEWQYILPEKFFKRSIIEATNETFETISGEVSPEPPLKKEADCFQESLF